MISYTPASTSNYASSAASIASETIVALQSVQATERKCLRWVFAAAIFLVSVPVFLQAPLVRSAPIVSLLLTLAFVVAGLRLAAQPRTQIWGDLMIGFAWTWFAGSVYWGWLRWEPFLHLPVEAVGLPFAIWGIRKGRCKIGHFFYLGSLLGTAVTDIFFYLIDLMPFWRTLMVISEASARPVFQGAIAKIQTPAGISWAIILAALLLIVGLLPLRSQKLYWWAFSGAVLSTILVDGLFWLAACAA